MASTDLSNARAAKNDEFYTDINDVVREIDAYTCWDPNLFKGRTVLLPCDDPEWSAFTSFFVQKFDQLGLHKLISTSYNPGGRGKVFTVKRDLRRKQTRIDDLEWSYLQGDGDFRSAEVTALRDEADFVITNPPFSLFREFLAWVREGGQRFSVIGNMNAVTCKEIFPLIRDGQLWYGPSISSGDREFRVPSHYPLAAAGCRVDAEGNRFIRVKGVRWFTNIDHGKRHEPLNYMTQADNLKFNTRLRSKRELAYVTYDNYDAIEVPVSSAIPSDYFGVMGVPISYLDKHYPEAFEILGISESADNSPIAALRVPGHTKYHRPFIDGQCLYARIFIRAIS